MHIKLQTPDKKKEYDLFAVKGISMYSGKKVWFSSIKKDGAILINLPSISNKQKVITIARQTLLKYIKDEQAKETLA